MISRLKSKQLLTLYELHITRSRERCFCFMITNIRAIVSRKRSLAGTLLVFATIGSFLASVLFKKNFKVSLADAIHNNPLCFYVIIYTECNTDCLKATARSSYITSCSQIFEKILILRISHYELIVELCEGEADFN